MKEFANEVMLDFSIESNLAQQKDALQKVRASFGKEYPNIIGGKEVITAGKTVSLNPASPKEIVGTFQKAGQSEAEDAMQAAIKAFETWKYVDVEERAGYFFKAAEEMRRRRFEINAWMISEVGKNYLEADADTCEAIDFLEFYGREALRYAQKQPLTPYPGESNEYFYIPLGVGLVIPPWNFPNAILVGMTTAAIVSGNTVVLKPSSDSPMMGWLFTEIMRSGWIARWCIELLRCQWSRSRRLSRYASENPIHFLYRFKRSWSSHSRICRKNFTWSDLDQESRCRNGRKRYYRCRF